MVTTDCIYSWEDQMKKKPAKMVDINQVLDLLEKRIWVTNYMIKSIVTGEGSLRQLNELRIRHQVLTELKNVISDLERGGKSE